MLGVTVIDVIYSQDFILSHSFLAGGVLRSLLRIIPYPFLRLNLNSVVSFLPDTSRRSSNFASSLQLTFSRLGVQDPLSS